jgi:TolB-like protein/Flp pilus assembly protein TadD
MAREELGTIAALDAGRDIFKTEIESRQGRVIDMAGDSILASFETAIGAVMAALRIQERLNELAAHLPDDRQMRFRIGVHVGDIREKDDGTIYGDGVNIAARLQGLAEPGGLTISGATQESVRHRLHATFEDLGEQHVKNIPYLVRAFRVDCGAVGGTVAQSPAADATGRASRTSNGGLRPSSTQVHPSPARSGIRASLRWTLAVGAVLLLSLGFAGAAWRWYAVAPTVGIDAEIMNRRAIALLVFSDKRGIALGSTLGEDMADLIAGRLVRDGVRVIGRAATVRQDSAAPEFERIGREQGVRFVLAGRVTRASTRILVDTYLTEIASGAVHRLHEAAFGSDEDAIRSNYASAVTIALNVRFHELEAIRARLPGREKSPVDALALGWHELDRSNTKGELESARARFEFAAAADPKSVEASAGLGLAHLLEFYDFHSASPGAKLDVAEKALKRALELGPGDPTSLAAWADILFLRQKPDEAFWVWRKALEISPEHGNAQVRLASALVKQGRFGEAGEHMGKVTDVQPFQLRRRQWLVQSMADSAFAQGKDDEAYEILKKWAAEFPNNGRPYLMLAAIDALHGRDASAAANMVKHRQMLPLSSVSYVVLTYPSTDPTFLAQRARLVDGLRKAHLPEGDR